MEIGEAVSGVVAQAVPGARPVITGKASSLSLPVTSSGARVEPGAGRRPRGSNTEVVVTNGRKKPRRMSVAGSNKGPAVVRIPYAQEERRARTERLPMPPFPETGVVEARPSLPVRPVVQTGRLVRAGTSVQGAPPYKTPGS